MFAISSICHAFDTAGVVGTKVKNRQEFENLLTRKLLTYMFPANGRGFVPLDEALSLVSSGVASRHGLPLSAYVTRQWRGEVELFAHRDFAALAQHVNVVIYQGDAYRTAPQVSRDESIAVEKAIYVIVAVIASVGPTPPVGSTRFVRNLAGDNDSYSPDNGYTIELAIEEARKIIDYERDWITVSD